MKSQSFSEDKATPDQTRRTPIKTLFFEVFIPIGVYPS
jgi:hypothetical protein